MDISNLFDKHEVASTELRHCLKETFVCLNSVIDDKLSDSIQEQFIENILNINSLPKDIRFKAIQQMEIAITSFLNNKEDDGDL